MFDIGFGEILLIALITLVVMGPQRLPETVRTAALWLGRLKHKLSDARRELENEIGIDEIRRQVYNERVMHNLEKTKSDLRNTADSASAAVNEIRADINASAADKTEESGSRPGSTDS